MKILKNLKIILRKFEKILQKLWEKLIKFCCTTMLNCRPKIIVYVSGINFLWSCMYWYTRYTTFSRIVFRTPALTTSGGAPASAARQRHIAIHDRSTYDSRATVPSLQLLESPQQRKPTFWTELLSCNVVYRTYLCSTRTK